MTRTTAWIFAAYALLAGSAWLLTSLPVQVHAIVFAAVGLLAGAALLRSRPKRQEAVSTWKDSGHLALLSLLSLAVPELLLRWSATHLSGSFSTSALAFAPVVLVLLAAQQQDGGPLHLLLPALSGLAGVLLLLPISFPASWASRLAISALTTAVLLIAFSSLPIYRVLQEFRPLEALTAIALPNAAVLCLGGLAMGWTETRIDGAWGSVFASGLELVLLVALLRGLSPVRLAARFFLVPLVAILEGFVLLHPGLTFRTAFGTALLALGALVLLLSRERQENTSLFLR